MEQIILVQTLEHTLMHIYNMYIAYIQKTEGPTASLLKTLAGMTSSIYQRLTNQAVVQTGIKECITIYL